MRLALGRLLAFRQLAGPSKPKGGVEIQGEEAIVKGDKIRQKQEKTSAHLRR